MLRITRVPQAGVRGGVRLSFVVVPSRGGTGIICCHLDLELPRSEFIHVLYLNLRGEAGLRTSLLEGV